MVAILAGPMSNLTPSPEGPESWCSPLRHSAPGRSSALIVALGLLAGLIACTSSDDPTPEELPPGIADPWAAVDADLNFEPQHIDLLARFATDADERTVFASCVETEGRAVHDVDPNGVLWTGGEDGDLVLLETDGSESTESLSRTVSLLRPLPEGRLVFFSDGELYARDAEGRTAPLRFEVDEEVSPYAFCGDPGRDAGNGFLFATATDGSPRIYRRQLGRWLQLGGGFEAVAAGFDWLGTYQGACALADGRLWFGQGREVWTLLPSELRGGMIPELVDTTSIAADPSFGVVLATRGIATLGPGEWTDLGVPATVERVAAGERELWVFTDAGVYHVGPESFERIAVPNLPSTTDESDTPRVLPFAGGFWWVTADSACAVLADERPVRIDGILPYDRVLAEQGLRVAYSEQEVEVRLDDELAELEVRGEWYTLALGSLSSGWHRLDISAAGARERQLYFLKERGDVLWESDIRPIAQGTCGLSTECHREATERPNLVSLDDWRTYASAVRDRALVQQDMPPADSGYPALSVSELLTIERWFEAGCPAEEDEGSCTLD